jgi:RNA polymerase sigma-70 factor (ECF subfamily)
MIERRRIGSAMNLLQPQQPATDAVLVARIGSGDAGAFGELYRRRRGDVYRFALHMTGSPSTAEDVAQDVFLAVMRSAARYEASRATAVVWLCGIARNCVRQRLDRDRPFQPLASPTGGPDAEPAVLPDPLGDLERAQRVERLRRMVLSLPLPYREAVVLCDLQELSYADAAVAMGCNVGTVRSRLHRGRELLASKLGAEPRQAGPAVVSGARCTT